MDLATNANRRKSKKRPRKARDTWRFQTPSNLTTNKLPLIAIVLLAWLFVMAPNITRSNAFMNETAKELAPLPMLCHSNFGRVRLKLPAPPPCQSIRSAKGKPIAKKFTLFRQNLVEYSSKAYHCIVTRKITKTMLYFFKDERLRKHKFETLKTSPEECRRMRERKRCRYGRLVSTSHGAYIARRGPEPKFVWCCRWYTFVQHTNVW